MDNQEIWKDVPNYVGVYQVSNFGKVKSLKYNKERFLKQNIIECGYYAVNLYNNGKQKTFQVHQLVAMAFLNHVPDGTNKIVIDHIDNNKLNNNINNLQLVSNRKNVSKEKIGNSKLPTGVSFHKRLNKYAAYIRLNRKLIHLGYFTEINLASEAYKNALKNIEQ